MEENGVDNVFNKLSDQMNANWTMLNGGASDGKWNEQIFNEMKRSNAIIEGRPYSFIKGGKNYSVEGNEITITNG